MHACGTHICVHACGTLICTHIGEDRREDITLVCSKMQLACSMAFKCISDHNLDVGYVFERVLDMPHTGFDLFRM